MKDEICDIVGKYWKVLIFKYNHKSSCMLLLTQQKHKTCNVTLVSSVDCTCTTFLAIIYSVFALTMGGHCLWPIEEEKSHHFSFAWPALSFWCIFSRFSPFYSLWFSSWNDQVKNCFILINFVQKNEPLLQTLNTLDKIFLVSYIKIIKICICNKALEDVASELSFWITAVIARIVVKIIEHR